MDKISAYIKACPKAQVFAVMQSGRSSHVNVRCGGPMAADGVFISNLVNTVVDAIRTKILQPMTPYEVMIGGGGDGLAGLQETLAEAALRGVISSNQVDSIMKVSREVNAGAQWFSEHACLNRRCHPA